MQARKKIITIFILSISINYLPLFPQSLVLFSPQDKPTKHLISYIKNAKSHIYAAVYMITDRKIAQALIQAKKKNNVSIEIITDCKSFESKYGKIKMLQKNNIDVFIFTPEKKSFFQPIMHNKFAIIDNKIWTGSFNWTISANRQNHENVIITDKKSIYKKYKTYFTQLKAQCSKTKPIKKRKKMREKGFFERLLYLFRS